MILGCVSNLEKVNCQDVLVVLENLVGANPITPTILELKENEE